ncbi:response regulator [Spirosoma sp. KUDC1026]|uniref:response regulator n=1 Tax=Spirosoma sp. KUDC1026 TaxID=2745947 RepID=UPI00159BD01E|nr:response regulator [Spirosoma sp. KUDC1026]QKZ14948.1 response regulator [Spirosoma sp. KUDC1026]
MQERSKRVILLVDDDEDDRFIVSQAFKLHAADNELIVVESGHQLLRLLEEGILPTLILLDLNMPILSGLETLALVRQQHSAANVPVIILTTSDLAEDKAKAASLQANDFITKPATASAYKLIIYHLHQRWLN